MNETYCLNVREISEEYKNTCLKLESFKNLYMLFLYNESYLPPIIPSLDNIDKDFIDKCPEKENVDSLMKKSSWINSKILGRDKILDNMKKNEQNFLLNSEQTGDINSDDTIYIIKYNSVLNE
ncbi:hypothetical protein PCYB_003850 [Plasmodium cynomolgi strain B]|uniref:CYIR protein n=1 Tax=Plasmodium cynomolgi (strain B) TaxID=1120755 RepID=K6UF80_PLACD|nr:hypothetical protein PCYB_003850 [Plasmodium cynomolgi strain B]GAB69636.1 hypothetical protein PCYB_003850 [Plasmodium cynomolgi strain B]